MQETLDSLDKAGGLGRKIGGDESKIGGEEMTVGGEERTVGGNEIKDGGKKRTMEDPNPSSHSVIERLDSLVMGTPVSSPDHDKLRDVINKYKFGASAQIAYPHTQLHMTHFTQFPFISHTI